MNIKRNVIVKTILTVLVVFSCLSFKNDEFIIKGYVDGVKENTLIILLNSNSEKIDSTFSAKGNFSFKGNVDTPEEHSIKIEKETFYFWIENTEITFKASITAESSSSVITGGIEQDLNNELESVCLPIHKEFEMYSHKKDRKKYKETISKYFKALKDFGKKHSNSYVGFDQLYNTRDSIAKDTLIDIYKKLPLYLKESTNGESLKIYLFEQIVEIGKPLIDFDAKTINNQKIKLSSLKGRYIYLHFWISGCPPCREENKFLSENFDKIPSDLEIVSFSLDKNKKHWKKSSEEDNILWTNISGSIEGNNKISAQYNVQGFPTSYLIDKNGIVIEKIWGSHGEGTIKYLKKLIKENP